MNAVNSNQYDKISDDKISDDKISDDEISGFANTTKVHTTKFLTTKFLATKFPPPAFCYPMLKFKCTSKMFWQKIFSFPASCWGHHFPFCVIEVFVGRLCFRNFVSEDQRDCERRREGLHDIFRFGLPGYAHYFGPVFPFEGTPCFHKGELNASLFWFNLCCTNITIYRWKIDRSKVPKTFLTLTESSVSFSATESFYIASGQNIFIMNILL